MGVEEDDEMEDPDFGMSISMGLTAEGNKVVCIRLPVVLDGGDVFVMGEARIDIRDLANLHMTLGQIMEANDLKPLKPNAAVAGMAEFANAKVDAATEVKREESELN